MTVILIQMVSNLSTCHLSQAIIFEAIETMLPCMLHLVARYDKTLAVTGNDGT
jgi:hypothetical protein